MTSPIAERLRELNVYDANGEYYAGGTDFMKEAAAEIDALRLALAGAEERAKTVEQKQFEAQDQGADFVLEALAKALGSPDWHPCDGTEEWEGDVIGTVYNILRAAKVFDPDTDELVTAKVTTLEARCAKLEGALAPALTEVRRFHHILRANGHDIEAAILAPTIANAVAAIAPAPGEGQ